MTVREILKAYLIKNNFDGFFTPGECACVLDDLAPCDGSILDCQPGWKRDATEEEYNEMGVDWVISNQKEAKND